jgi:hypothetical protein
MSVSSMSQMIISFSIFSLSKLSTDLKLHQQSCRWAICSLSGVSGHPLKLNQLTQQNQDLNLYEQVYSPLALTAFAGD